MDTPEYKTCCRCQQVLPRSAYSRRSKSSDGLSSHCKPCAKKERRAYYLSQEQNNPETKRHRREWDLRWAEEHKDDEQAHALIRAKQKVRDRRYRLRHKDDPAYRERKQKKNQRHYGRHRTRILQQTAAYAVKHRERDRPKRRANWQRYRANKANAPINDLTRQQWAAIKRHYGQRCVYCNLKTRKLTMDHIIPISKGGSHTFTNVVPACLSCNSGKRDRAPLIPVQPLLLLPPDEDKKKAG